MSEQYNPLVCKQTREDVARIKRAVFEGNGKKSLKEQTADNHEALYGNPNNDADKGMVGAINNIQKRQTRHTIILALLIFAPEAIETLKPYLVRIFL
jgi:hypothetical protein